MQFMSILLYQIYTISYMCTFFFFFFLLRKTNSDSEEHFNNCDIFNQDVILVKEKNILFKYAYLQ